MIEDKAFDEMEKDLLPVFAEAVKLCKKISGNQDYFRNYKSARRLYAMALVSRVVRSINAGIDDNECKKSNIERIDLLSDRRFYKSNTELGAVENVFQRAEVVSFKENMQSLGVSYFDDAIINDCLGCLERDCAIGMWEGEKPLLNTDGKVLDWKSAKNLSVFRFASAQMKDEMFVDLMNKRSKEEKWDRKEWNKNYPLVMRGCEKALELKFAQYCQDKIRAYDLVNEANNIQK